MPKISACHPWQIFCNLSGSNSVESQSWFRRIGEATNTNALFLLVFFLCMYSFLITNRSFTTQWAFQLHSSQLSSPIPQKLPLRRTVDATSSSHSSVEALSCFLSFWGYSIWYSFLYHWSEYFIMLWRVVLFSFAVGEAWQRPLYKDWSQQPSLKFEEVHSYTNRIPFHSIRTRGMLAAENRNNANSWFQSFPVCFALPFLYTHYIALDGFIRLHCRIVESSNVTWKAWQLD